MCKNSSSKHYHENKERLPEKACGRYQSLSQEEKENMVMNNTKIYQKMKNKSLLSIEKNTIK